MVNIKGDPPLFTVLMPTHNRADVLGAAIRSVLDQSETSFELFVVGDGCTDGSADVVAGFDDPRVIWFDLPKAPGFGYANRNIALQRARGELFAFAAHDDLYFPDHLKRMAEMFRRPQINWAYSRPLWVRDDGVVIPFFGNIRIGTERALFEQRNFIPASCVVFRRELHDRSGGWPEDVERTGDWVMWRRMLADHPHSAIGFCRQPTVLHFRANWRDPAKWAPVPLPYLSALADSSRIWPDSLKLRFTSDGGLPQHQMLNLLATEAQRICARLRQGTENLQDEIAWSAVVNQPFHRQIPMPEE